MATLKIILFINLHLSNFCAVILIGNNRYLSQNFQCTPFNKGPSTKGKVFHLDLFVSNTKMSWISAVLYCRENNGSLIILDGQDKWDCYTMENQQNHGGQLANEQFWIGMNTSTDTCQDYQWLESINVTWTRWAPGYPSYCDERKCVKLKYDLMRTAICSMNWKALCEKDSNLTSSQAVSTDVSSTTDDVLHTTETTKLTTTGNADVSHMTSIDTVTKSFGTESIATSANFLSSTTVSHDTLGTITSNDVKHTTEAIDDVVNTTADMRCCCTGKIKPQPTLEQLHKMTVELRESLTVMKSNTSTNRRKLISVYDSRPSSVAIGTLGCAILVSVLFFILSSDLVSLVKWFIHIFGNKRNVPND